MGDDINDLSALEIAGLSAAPANARPAVLEKCQFITKATAGNGAVRELIDHLLAHSAIGASGETTVL
jgi:3-deoxy-D-manno-octulosonate 8-phosphate phosphatase (KDO 8-P phosphatase)